MCMMPYLAAEVPLSIVPWDESAPAFNTSVLAPHEERVRTQFGKPHACWDGDQESLPEHRRTLTPSALENDSFLFLEKELSTVDRDVA